MQRAGLPQVLPWGDAFFEHPDDGIGDFLTKVAAECVDACWNRPGFSYGCHIVHSDSLKFPSGDSFSKPAPSRGWPPNSSTRSRRKASRSTIAEAGIFEGWNSIESPLFH